MLKSSGVNLLPMFQKQGLCVRVEHYFKSKQVICVYLNLNEANIKIFF